MLSKADNDLLTQTGPGTPMGEVFRRFWLPAVLSEELPEPDCEPIRLMLLSEEMVAFRDSSGKVGILERQCPHRLADMWFGRNELNGLACAYHGWKFDVEGNCVDMPTETAESGFKHKVKMRHYPSVEFGGVVWVYMGPLEKMPEVPQFEWCRVPAENRWVKRWLQESNYMQATEGDIDSAHISFNHKSFAVDPNANTVRGIPLAGSDGAPRLTVRETDYGFMYGSRRGMSNGDYYWRVTQFLLPFWSLIPSPQWPVAGAAWVPIDDHNIQVIRYSYSGDEPLSQAALDARNANPVLTTRAPHKLANGTIIDIQRSRGTRDNDYLISREMQKTVNFTGIASVREQDMAMTDGMKPIVPRWREHLGTTDVAIIAARRQLLKLAHDMQNGKDPYPAFHGDLYHVRPIDVVSSEADFDKVLTANMDKAAALV